MKAEKIAPPLLPLRATAAHKGDSGRLLCVGGAAGTSGAARLSARGALCAGTGLLTLAVPEPIRAEVAHEDPAYLTMGLRSTIKGTLAYPAAREIIAKARTVDALAIGPGLSTDEDTVACVLRVLSSVDLPSVVDADALNAIASTEVPPRSGVRVFTPHPGEASRLLKISLEAVLRDREAAAAALWKMLGGVIVLKGAGTLVTDGTVLLINTTGNPGLATGGSGDVLTGMIGAFLAAGLPPLQAATAAVHIHGQAADELRQSAGERGLSMRALLEVLPGIVAGHESAA